MSKKILVLCLFFLLFAINGFSANYNPDCSTKTNLKSKYLCLRYPYIAFAATNHVYIDLEEVQSFSWPSATSCKVVFKNGKEITYSTSAPVVKFEAFMHFLDQNPEFIK